MVPALAVVAAMALVVPLLIGDTGRAGAAAPPAPIDPRAGLSGGPAAPAVDCRGVHPADLIPLRPAERSWNLICASAALKAMQSTAVAASVDPPGFGIYNQFLTYDAADRSVLLLGATGVGPLNGTETWTYRAGAWTQLTPAASPESCVGSVLAYDDADGYAVYFGGANLASGSNCTSAGETWTFSNGSWTQLSPATSPPARQGAAFANDSGDGYMVLFGGLSTACTTVCNDTWTFAGGTWTQLHPTTSPSNRSGAGLAYDAADGYLLLFGGSSVSCLPVYPALYCMDRDTWSFHAGTWQQLAPGGPVPPEPFDDGLTYDAADHAVLYTVTDDNQSGEPEIWWTYSGNNWTNPANNSGPMWNVSRGSLPQNRFGEGLAYDAADGYAVLFGGTGVQWQPLRDTWSYASGVWTNRSVGNPPVPTFYVNFTASGAPSGAGWSVTLGNASVGTSGGGISFSVPNGSYPYAVTAPNLYRAVPSSGLVVVSGAAVGVAISFVSTPGAPPYNVTFHESGLAQGSPWSVNISGVLYAGSSSSIVLTLGNGTYSYTVTPIVGYRVSAASTLLVVAGAPVTVQVTFEQVYSVGFLASGLPAGANWSVLFGTQRGVSASNAIVFAATAGTYAFVVNSSTTYQPFPSGGTLRVAGSLEIAISFLPPSNATYPVAFFESGLPSATTWSVVVTGTTYSGFGPEIDVGLPNGTYAYSIPAVGNFLPAVGSGTVFVVGSGLSVNVTFLPFIGPPPPPPPVTLDPGVYLAVGILAGFLGGIAAGFASGYFVGRRSPRWRT